MLKTTRANVNKRMAVVLIEKRRETSDVNGRKVTRDVTDEEVINDATIRGIFSNNFQITGLAAGEARELALLLRSGSLAIPLYPIDERAVGPSVGRDNIDKGVTALIVGMAGVFVFMAIYYKTFGLVADAVLLSNVVLLTALLSMMRASLSLPGIAGIILTVGMAVDANEIGKHTSELQSRFDLVCRLLLEKKKKRLNRGAPRGLALVPLDVLADASPEVDREGL